VDGALAIAQHDYEHAIELEPDAYFPSGMVTQAYEALGNSEATAAAYRRALASLGFAERAREWTRRALLFDPDNRRMHYNLACAMATLNDVDMAAELIEPLIDKVSDGFLRWMQADNSLDAIRQHPRFAAVMERAARRFAAETR
jgi:tetratricopeptide (TPR) repeat protein